MDNDKDPPASKAKKSIKKNIGRILNKTKSSQDSSNSKSKKSQSSKTTSQDPNSRHSQYEQFNAAFPATNSQVPSHLAHKGLANSIRVLPSASDEWNHHSGHRPPSLINSSSSPGALGSVLASAAAPFRVTNLGYATGGEFANLQHEPYSNGNGGYPHANDYSSNMSNASDYVNRRPGRPGYGQGPGPNARNSNSSNEEHQETNHRRNHRSNSPSLDMLTAALEKEDGATINRLFEELILDEMNLKEEQKVALRKKSKEDKLFLLRQKVKLSTNERKNDSSSKSKFKNASDYVTFLQNNQEPHSIYSKELAECVKSLKIELRGNGVSWVREFGKNNGHIDILTIIRLCSQARTDNKKPVELMADCVQCLSSFMNNKAGFNMIFQYDQAFVILVQSLDPRYPSSMSKTLELLAAVTLVEHGVERVLNAFTDAAVESGRKERFWIIVEGLKCWKSKDIGTAIASIQLLNCLITNHEDFEQRFHLRSEIYRTSDEAHKLDFRTIAAEVEPQCAVELNREREGRAEERSLIEPENESISSGHTNAGRPLSASNSINNLTMTNMPQSLAATAISPNQKFINFFVVFFQSKDEDFDEMANRFENIRIDFDDMDDCYKLLRQTVLNTPVEPYLLSILQLLLYIRDDQFVKPAYYLLIEECLMQILFHKSGVDPDFKPRSRFDLDVNFVIESIQKKLKESENTGMSVELNQKLEEAITAKMEVETKLEQQLKQVQELNEKLKAVESGAEPRPSITIPPPPPPPPGSSIPPPPPPPPGSGIPPPPPPPPGSGIPPPPPPPPGMGGPPPPPPPPPGMGGPPPPPPPPGMGGPPPPPPPFGAPMGPPPPEFPFNIKRAMFEPKKGLKKPNWKKLTPNKVQENSIWIQVSSDETLVSEDLMDSIVENFASVGGAGGAGLKGGGSAGDKQSVANGAANGKATPMTSKKVVKCRVLSDKTAQNLGILLGALKMSPDDFTKDVITMNEEHLSENILGQILHYMPTMDELNRLNDLAKSMPIDEFHQAEKFAIALGSIKGLSKRLRHMLFKMKFNEALQEVKKDIVSYTMACGEVRKSEKFATLLKLVLSIGNFMNAGGRNARAIGFEISFLPKLNSTKTVDNKSTLLHFIADKMEEKFPESAKFYSDLLNLDKAAKASPENITKSLASMKASIRELDLDLKNFKSHSEEDRFGPVMNEFRDRATEEYTVLEGMHKKMESLYIELASYFSFEPKQYTMDECFGDIKLFKDQYMQAAAENFARREQEEKARRAKEQKEKREKEMKERPSTKISLNQGNDANDQGLMEHLLNSLHSGTAFAPRRKRTKAVTPQDRRQQLSRSRSRSSLDQRGSLTPVTPSTPTSAGPNGVSASSGQANGRRPDHF